MKILVPESHKMKILKKEKIQPQNQVHSAQNPLRYIIQFEFLSDSIHNSKEIGILFKTSISSK